MGSDFVNINFVFKVRYSCRSKDCGGDKPALLFSLSNGFLGRGDKNTKKKDDGNNNNNESPPTQEGGGQ
jgi:hypothetical protein